MNRDDFVNQLIEELQKQQNDSISDFNGKSKGCHEIFQALCYDYPIVASHELQILKEGLESLLHNNTNQQKFNEVFGFNDKFFENLIYLSGINDKCDDDVDTSLGNHNANICDICALVYLKLPSYLLSCNQKEASQLVTDKINFIDNNINTNSLSWYDICKLFHTNILKSTASLLVGIGSRTLLHGDYLTRVMNAITLVHPKIMNNEFTNTTEMTFAQYIQSVNIRIKQQKKNDNDSINNNDNISSEEDYIVQTMMQDIWIHLIFLVRDLLIQFPELLPKTLPQLCEALLTEEDAAESVFLTVDKKAFPTSSECLLVLVFSSIAISISVIPNSTSSTAMTTSLEMDEVKAIMIKKQVRIKRIISARACLKKIIDPINNKLTDIIERMLHHSPDKGIEAAAMLCDIIQLFITLDESITMTPLIIESINNSHEKMIASRMLSILAKIRIDLLSESNNDKGNNMIATVSRITRLLSVVCLQRVETGIFLIRLPNFNKSINLILETWKSNNQQDIIVKSGCLVSLLFGLIASLDSSSVKTNNDIIAQLELALQCSMNHIMDEFTRINLILSSKDLNDSNTGRLIRSDNILPLIDSLTISIEAQSIKLLNATHQDMIRLWTIDIVNITNTITSKIISKKSNQVDIDNNIDNNMVDKSLDCLDDNLSYYDDIKRLCKGFRSLLESQETTKID